ncbi:hypothetical protein ACIA8K_29840 [Catenuloplanes sp. NPDC051500]|uniref:hypothetical protein n=1 Tax=Catenuloplanes sp. NPDC051500 TaxID=3363959 RepID=UPI0037A564E8
MATTRSPNSAAHPCPGRFGREDLEAVAVLMAAGELRPYITRVYAFAQVDDVETGQATGKLTTAIPA